MESYSIPHRPPSTSSFSSRHRSLSKLPISYTKFSHYQTFMFPPPTHLSAALQSPRGFGPSPKKKKKSSIKKKVPLKDDRDEEKEDEDDDDEELDGVIPEVVTNRMLSRIGLSVGIPLFVGLVFFPFFYYLKVGLNLDIPTWIPFIVSFIFFGSAFVGVTYGIVSTSWDPMRQGSALGWNEAKRNWPVFLQSIRGRSGRN